MFAQKILTLAHQGHPIAIATLLNYLTLPHGMRVRVQRQGDRLHVLLEAGVVPNAQETVETIQDNIQDLQVQQVSSVTIYGRQQGKRLPAWQQTVYLKTEADLSDTEANLFDRVDSRADRAPDANIGSLHFTHVARTTADFLDPLPVAPPLLPMEASETPDIFKRPQAIVLILFAALLIFWDTYTSLLDEDDVLPTATLSTSQLARRLQTSRSTIRRRKRLADFGNWTQNLDPDGIAWTYRKGAYIPLALEASLLETE